MSSTVFVWEPASRAFRSFSHGCSAFSASFIPLIRAHHETFPLSAFSFPLTLLLPDLYRPFSPLVSATDAVFEPPLTLETVTADSTDGCLCRENDRTEKAPRST